MKRLIYRLWHAFPMQLLLMHVRKDQVFLFFWTLLFLTVTEQIGRGMGFSFLFLDPEYLNKTNFLSTALVGFAFGCFNITWNLVSYLLSSRKFSFLASLNFPFATFFVNNLLLPLVFVVCYMFYMLRFQFYDQLRHTSDMVIMALGFFAGFSLATLIGAAYFYFTNTTAKLQHLKRRRGKYISKAFLAEDEVFDKHKWLRMYKVQSFLSTRLSWRSVRSTAHYPAEVQQRVLQQHHYNALLIQMASIIILIILGFFMDNSWMQIPAAACIFLFFSVLLSLAGFIRYWAGPWASTAVLALIFGFNFLTQYGFMNWDNQAYGLDYAAPKPTYQYHELEKIASGKNQKEDMQHTLQILDEWKKKTNEQRPKLILLTNSGGGFRSAYFSMRVLQKADSISNGQLMQHTAFMSGASGGTFALAYYRELYRKQLAGDNIKPWQRQHAINLTRDLVNPISFATLTNDIFYPMQKTKVNGKKYLKDRGYLMEKEFNHNTSHVFEKPLKAYKRAEDAAEIPMLVSAATITNDMRKLIVSPQKLSYMMQPISFVAGNKYEIDAVDFQRMYAGSGAGDLRMSTALRMNATYPYLMPAVSLPSDPPMRVYDAGIIDNFGTEVSVRFLLAMKDWINENTSGVVFVQILDHKKIEEIERAPKQTYLNKMLNPAGMIYGNLSVQQDYDFDHLLNMCSGLIQQPMHLVRFEYESGSSGEQASITLRLTQREMSDIERSVNLGKNKTSFARLQQLLSEQKPL